MKTALGWFLGALVIIAVLAVTRIATAEAANSPHFTLDSIASQVAGKPVSIHCETNNQDWDAMVGVNFPGRRGDQINGYAVPGSTVAFISPRACLPLQQALRTNYRDAGLVFLTIGLHVLIHEAVHLRGVRNEGETDCAALAEFGNYVDDVGVPLTVTKLVRKTKTVLVRGIRVRTSTVVTVRVPNPDVARMRVLAQQLRDAMPIEYRGDC